MAPLDEPSAETVTGSFQLSISIGSGVAPDPCVQGMNLGSFHITASESTISVDPTDLDLAAALAEVLTGTFTLCFAITGDIDAGLTLTELEIRLDVPGSGCQRSR